MKKLLSLLLVLTMLLAMLAGCASQTESQQTADNTDASGTENADTSETENTETTDTDDKVKIAYICKDLTNPWFVLEDNGLKDKAEELGVEYFAIDAHFDDEACDAAISNALAQDIDGLAICITNQGNGPAVAMQCREKGVELITIDDGFEDENGEQVPHVGMPTEEVGYVGGTALAEKANELGFFEEGNVVKVLQIYTPDVSVHKPRIDGYQKALMENTPLTEDDFIPVEAPESMLEDSLAAVQPVLQAHPEVTHWICGGINDDSAVAAIKAIEEQGKVPLENTLVCGLGGYSLAIEEFERGNENFMTMVLDPYKEGSEAMRILYEKITEGTEMPTNTFINGQVATIDNWQDLIEQ